MCLQVRYSSQSLFEYLKSIQQDVTVLQQFGDTLLLIFRDNLRNDRYNCTEKHNIATKQMQGGRGGQYDQDFQSQYG